METRIRVLYVPPTTLVAFLEACAAHPNQPLEVVAEFAGFSVSTARKALPTLESLGLVVRDENATFSLGVPGIRRGGDSEHGRLIIRRALQSYRPFEAVCEGLALGESASVAIRKAALLLGISKSESVKFAILVRLGLELGILEGSADRPRLAAELAPNDTVEVSVLSSADVESEAKARLFNARWLGREVYNQLDETDRQLLCEAVMTFRDDPRQSVDSAGQALEDFLRELANSTGHAAQAKKANGAGQLAGVLVAASVIHSHHQKLVDAVSTARNATAHHKDKKTLAPWEITPHGAFTVLAGALTAVRSIGNYALTGRQTI